MAQRRPRRMRRRASERGGPARFRVEAFRRCRARMKAVGRRSVAPTDVEPRDVQVSYPRRRRRGRCLRPLRSSIDDKFVTFPDYDDYRFAGGDVKVATEEQGDCF